MSNAQPYDSRVGNTRARTPGRYATLGQKFALASGALFLLVGVLGFIPGITQNFGDMTFAGHESEAELLGIFQVSVLHNIVHLLFGVALVAAASRHDLARNVLLASGVIYLLLAIYGFLIDHDSDANFVPVNRSDDWLHVALGVGLLAMGLLATKDDADHTGTTRRQY